MAAAVSETEIDVAADAIKALDQEAEMAGRPMSYYYMARKILEAAATVRGRVIVNVEAGIQ